MSKLGKIFLVTVLFITLNLPASPWSSNAYAAQTQPTVPSGAAMLVDGILVRPLGVVATLIGSVVFVVTLPFSLLGGNVGDAGQALVGDPARLTFMRPLGEFD
ncbi:MAG: hypothetical protein ABFS45_03845 [Pseudomonadota bacterium]